MTQAMKKFKSYQIVDNFFIYSITALTCSVFCFSPFWFPYLLASIKAFLFVSLPKVGVVLLSPKVLFFVGNLIIIILIGESKFFASESSPASDVCYDDYVSKSTRSVKNPSTDKCLTENVKKTGEDIGENVVMRKWVDEEEAEVGAENGNNEEDDEVGFPAEELSKRADDFIARVNWQRRLEARLLLSCSE